jgi:dTDP-4-amino-4,6-dideoxygalactose transaminase
MARASVSTKLAVDGGTKVHEGPWPQWPIWDETEEKALLDVLRSGQWWGPNAPQNAQFEEAFARYHDARHGVCVTSGTAALEVSLRALDIGFGDEVILPPYTFVATASSVLSVGALPVFADIEPGSLTIDPARIEEAITPRTKAVIAVHIAGRPADLDGVLAVARRHGLYVIEDAAQAHGAAWKGRKVGAIGDLGAFSFQATKNLNAGEGGIILSDNADLSERCWAITNVGWTRSGRRYEPPVLGSNYRITVWQAALLNAQLQRLPAQTARRSENAAYLTAQLASIPGIITLSADPRVTGNAYHLYIFRYDPARFGNRTADEFRRALQAEGIPCRAGYAPLYKDRLFQGKIGGSDGKVLDYTGVHCPVCEQVCQDAAWLAQTVLLGTKKDMDDIAEAVRKIQRAWG